MAKCLILGANGFLGSHLVDSLVDRGHQVRAFDRFASKDIRFNQNSAIEIVDGNFLNRHDLSQALDGIDYVFHFISTTTPITSEDDPLIDVETNIRMSIELFQECVEHKVKKVIFASTGGAIYGTTNGMQAISEDTNPRPISPYAIGKLTIENYLHYFEKKHGLSSLVFRISNPYGERQSLVSKQGVIPIFLERIAKNEPITVFGDGSMVRDYIYVKDVTEMIASSFEESKNNLYNLGSGTGVSINELVEAIKPIVNKPIEIKTAPTLSTFVERVVLDVSRFQNDTGLKPHTSLAEGIKKTWDYIEEQM